MPADLASIRILFDDIAEKKFAQLKVNFLIFFSILIIDLRLSDIFILILSHTIDQPVPDFFHNRVPLTRFEIFPVPLEPLLGTNGTAGRESDNNIL